jgi:aconitate hydratase
MVNGLGVVGWGVGGIEAEAAMLGQPISMLIPQVLGVRLTGAMPQGATATDLVLTITELLRKTGVVGKFVEFFGPGLSSLTIEDQATIANMSPEYGATCGFFPVSRATIDYLRATGREEARVNLVEAYAKEQGMWFDPEADEPVFTDVLELDLSSVLPSLAGPKRPQDRVLLSDAATAFGDALAGEFGKKDEAETRFPVKGESYDIGNGDVVIAAITSCTNTSNPDVMVGAGLVARKARELGLTRKPWVKTSLAPGSKVVTEYLTKSGLLTDLEGLGFHVVGYGCTTCIGNSGPLPEPISEAINANDLVGASVLSGNRNFEGRISPDVRANYLASPPLVVAYALAGTVDWDPINEPIGSDRDGNDVMLADIWPSQGEIARVVGENVLQSQFIEKYADVFTGSDEWRAIDTVESDLYDWNPDSTYVQEPPFFQNLTPEITPIVPIIGARVLAKLGDSVTTDHISPAGSIAVDSPAGRYLIENGVQPAQFNSYGSRRGNDRVMTRGTFANIRVKNQLAPDTEGGWTTDFTDGQVRSIFDAAMNYQVTGTPLIVLGGVDYGMGSSRDWAAKGTFLLGVKAVITSSFERIHRSNLVMMGVLPLVFKDGENSVSLGLDGTEAFNIEVDDTLQPRQTVRVTATHENGTTTEFETVARVDTPIEVEYLRNGGILHYVLRQMAGT